MPCVNQTNRLKNWQRVHDPRLLNLAALWRGFLQAAGPGACGPAALEGSQAWSLCPGTWALCGEDRHANEPVTVRLSRKQQTQIGATVHMEESFTSLAGNPELNSQPHKYHMPWFALRC